MRFILQIIFYSFIFWLIRAVWKILNGTDVPAGTRENPDANAGESWRDRQRRANDGLDWEHYFFRCLGKIAKADGQVSRNEIDIVQQLFANNKYSAEKQREMAKQFNFGRDTERSFESLVNDLRATLSTSYYTVRLVRTIVLVFCTIASADGAIHPREREMLEIAGRVLNCRYVIDEFLNRGNGGNANFGGNGGNSSRGNANSGTSRERDFGGNADSHARGNANSLAEAYQLLGVPTTASDAEVKKAWRTKMMEFHPDKIQASGLAQAFVDFAKERSQAINAAYDAIKRERGMK